MTFSSWHFRKSRRAFSRLVTLTALAAWLPRRAEAMGDESSFHARILSTGQKRLTGIRETAPSRWAWELVRRTSAPARLTSQVVAADDRALLREPFVLWAGSNDVPPLTREEVRNLRRFLKMGGVLMVDDLEPESGAFGRSARREIARVVPESPVVRLDPKHVIYKSYYILDRPVGRVLGPPHLDAIVRGKNAQVIFSSHDLLGALSRKGSQWAMSVTPGGAEQREHAVRLAVNLAMYVLCSDYKDDQVHAPWLMRRRARSRQ